MARPQCTACEKVVPLPPLACFECVHVDQYGTSTATTYYCDTHCQASDHNKHTTTCKTRRSLYRAGEILQSTFYLWREIAFDINVPCTWRNPVTKNLEFYEDSYGENNEAGPLFKFPEVEDAKDRAAMLSFLACTDALMYLSELTEKLLKDITNCIEEVQFAVVKDSLTVLRFRMGVLDPESDQDHQAIAIEAVDGQAYIIDFAGAQYNQYDAVQPFDVYMNSFVTKIKEVNSLGTIAARGRASDGNKFGIPVEDTCDLRIRKVHLEMHQRFLAAIKEWEDNNKMDVRHILALGQQEYELKRNSITTKLRHELEFWILEWKMDGCKIQPRSYEQGDEAARLTRVARIEQEFNPYRGDDADRTQSRAYKHWAKDFRAQPVFNLLEMRAAYGPGVSLPRFN